MASRAEGGLFPVGAPPVFFSLLHRGAKPSAITISFIFIDMSRRKRHSRELGSISYGLQCFGGIPFSHNFSTPRILASHPSHPTTKPPIRLSFLTRVKQAANWISHLNLRCIAAVAALFNFILQFASLKSSTAAVVVYKHTRQSWNAHQPGFHPNLPKNTCQRLLYQIIYKNLQGMCLRRCQITQLDIQHGSEYRKCRAEL